MPDDPIEACVSGPTCSRPTRSAVWGFLGGLSMDRYFLFHVGLGFDAAVVQQVERRGELKRWMSHVLFAYCAFLTWFVYFDRSRPRFVVTHR